MAGGAVSPIPSHDEHLLASPRCACGSPIVFRRRSVMGASGSELTFAAWCQANPDHVLPEAVARQLINLFESPRPTAVPEVSPGSTG